MTDTAVNIPSEDRLRQVFNLLERHIEQQYGVPVHIRDVPHPFTGDLDGAEIHVDYEQDVEAAVFIIAHLFGHTVQWNLSPEARAVGLRPAGKLSATELEELRSYEIQACRYSLQLFHELGIHDLDQWVSDFAACDYAYLEHFFRTGERRNFRDFWRDQQPLITPLPIPTFSPQRWVSRWEGVVV